MKLRHVVENFEGHLTKSDKRLVEALLSDLRASAFLSSVQLADRVGVHPATVVRLAKKLGFSGFPDLRAKIREEAVNHNSAKRVEKRLQKMGVDSILQSLIDSEIQALQSIPDHVSDSQLKATARVLIDAKRIVLFGIGHAAELAELMARRLNRSGYAATALHHIGWETPETIARIEQNGVLIAFAVRHIPKGLSGLIAHIKAVGGKTIIISDLLRPGITNFFTSEHGLMVMLHTPKEVGYGQKIHV